MTSSTRPSRSIDGILSRRPATQIRPAAPLVQSSPIVKPSQRVISDIRRLAPTAPTLQPKNDTVVLRRPGWAQQTSSSGAASAVSTPVATRLEPQLKPKELPMPIPAVPYHEPSTSELLEHVESAKSSVPTQKKPTKKRRALLIAGEIIQYPFIAAAAVVAAYNSSIGQWFVVAYIVYALLRRRGSRHSFALALVMLVTVPFFQIINQADIAENTAIYTYELLAFGTVQAIFELFWRERKQTKLKKA